MTTKTTLLSDLLANRDPLAIRCDILPAFDPCRAPLMRQIDPPARSMTTYVRLYQPTFRLTPALLAEIDRFDQTPAYRAANRPQKPTR